VLRGESVRRGDRAVLMRRSQRLRGFVSAAATRTARSACLCVQTQGAGCVSAWRGAAGTCVRGVAELASAELTC
jgi:hypothetical protein